MNPAIAKAFAELADERESRREQAEVDLMGLSVEDLPALREVVREARPLWPGQAAALHEIVCQIAARSIPYECSATEGFLGIHWPSGEPMAQDVGVCVDQCVAGLCGNRYLRTDDIIVAVEDRPRVDCKIQTSFTNYIKALGPGSRVRLLVERHGALVHEAIVLDARPLIADREPPVPTQVQDWIELRAREAEKVWADMFGDEVEIAGR